MRFVNHSSYDNWTLTVEGDNVSNIVDKLIRLAAKNTEYYASDIVYLINAFTQHVAEKEPFISYLGFRDGGVNWYKDPDYISDPSGIIQWWKLAYDPIEKNGRGYTILIRQDLRQS